MPSRSLNPRVAVVAAAGNNGSESVSGQRRSTASSSVGALDTTNGQQALASFSNYGDWVDIYAPGVGVRSTYLDATWKLPTDKHGLAHLRLGDLERHVLRGAAGRRRDREPHDSGGRNRVPGVRSRSRPRRSGYRSPARGPAGGPTSRSPGSSADPGGSRRYPP